MCFMGGGRNILIGGEGADTFRVNDSNQGVDTVEDFEVGSDMVQVLSENELTFDDIFLTQEDSVAIIEAGDATIHLQGVDVDDLREDDFILI